MPVRKAISVGEIQLVSQVRPEAIALEHGIEILSEQVFMHLLRLERRRTERSGNPFILVLVKGADFQAKEPAKLIRGISTAIASCTRETDVLGWYEQDHTLALLMTELGDADLSVTEVIARKIIGALRKAIGSEELSRIYLQIRVYPQPSGSKGDGEREDLIYRDLSAGGASNRGDQTLKRVLDVFGSATALILLSPVFLMIALLIKLTSKGPVFFCQKRVGRYGRLFDFFKFRSMYPDNDPAIHQAYVTKLIAGADGVKQGNGTYKLVNDPRITPLGRFLRKTSLDELPQFVNVLRGDMSLVGPRPPVPYEYECYRLWHKRRVLEIQPGLTGLWQIKGRSRTTFDEMVRMDIRYAESRSLWQDIWIILQTPIAMFTGNGAA
jgi:lipopolysaccharide/colanic/teichoic acid biosynthesis glycosyltransferase